MTELTDLRQRFFIADSPVRGDVVRLQHSYATITAQKEYPESIKRLLGEMLTAASLLIGTLKIDGTLSIQLQSSDESSLLNWAMAECDQSGIIRALASWKNETEEQQQAWANKASADEAFAELGAVGKGVMFINIQPAKGEAYQGIVERSHNNLAECLAHYQLQSAQIPTLINLACDGLQAGGILVQMLPRTAEEQYQVEQDETAGIDDDLWTRLTLLTRTVKFEELTTLDANEIIYRLYNEESVVAPDPVALEFGCTCSRDKCEAAIAQIGEAEALEIVEEQGGTFEMDCGFCGSIYKFNKADIEEIFS
ncbi:MAG TPA: Hsp33 family molecular chaperone HslO [Psychrobacter sp.]|uniref:33 kDa chaperonin n=1 Tax=Psychrobacter pasteurii TaxID=1945520 RepID=A0A1R4EFF1_9GAMM|nr:Hsp33 family molecular chaperone HslO [Psychrobacter pasteurii]SJM37217.1 33 kDa chaperonin [Psychrobacter pasteurii]HAO60290.1 Hsp33 family molecular chaperone HslO [Psychrobacter sp.]HJH08857.1 Hsp33 family molecular chaperone HslO [Psychrobacter pasteurii]